MLNLLKKIKNKFFPKRPPSYVKLGKNTYVNPTSQIGCPNEIGEWNWSEEKMKRNKKFFEIDLTSIATTKNIIQ